MKTYENVKINKNYVCSISLLEKVDKKLWNNLLD